MMQTFKPYMDLEIGDAANGFMVPGWMPRKMDNIAVWKQVVADYCKTTDWDSRDEPTQRMFLQIYDALEQLEQRRLMQVAAQGQDMAAQLGAQNAAAPQGPAAMAQPQGLSRDQAAPAALTPGQ